MRWNGAVYIWAVWGCTADICVHWKGKRGIKFRCPVHANSLSRFILTSRKRNATVASCGLSGSWQVCLSPSSSFTAWGMEQIISSKFTKKKRIVFHARALQVFNLKLRLIRLIRVLFPCIYIISKGSLPPPVCVHTCMSLEFFKVLAFTCLTWTADCNLLASSPADIGSCDQQAFWKPAGMPGGTLIGNRQAHLHSCAEMSGKLLKASFFPLLLWFPFSKRGDIKIL